MFLYFLPFINLEFNIFWIRIAFTLATHKNAKGIQAEQTAAFLAEAKADSSAIKQIESEASRKYIFFDNSYYLPLVWMNMTFKIRLSNQNYPTFNTVTDQAKTAGEGAIETGAAVVTDGSGQKTLKLIGGKVKIFV